MKFCNRTRNSITILDIGNELAKGDNGTYSVFGPIEIDVDNHMAFLSAINKLLEIGINNIVVNLSNVSYMDSSGFGAIYEGYKKTQATHGNLKLCYANRDIQRGFDVTKFSKKIEVFNTEESAITSFSI